MTNIFKKLGVNSIYEIEINLKRVDFSMVNLKHDNYLKIAELFKKILGNKITTKEYVYAFYFTHNYILKGYAEISNGGTKQSIVENKIVAQHAVLLLAENVVLIHNHPTGICKPSLADLKVYETLNEGLNFLHINLLDFIIVSDVDVWSINDKKEEE